jgi:hypothetical protein
LSLSLPLSPSLSYTSHIEHTENTLNTPLSLSLNLLISFYILSHFLVLFIIIFSYSHIIMGLCRIVTSFDSRNNIESIFDSNHWPLDSYFE